MLPKTYKVLYFPIPAIVIVIDLSNRQRYFIIIFIDRIDCIVFGSTVVCSSVILRQCVCVIIICIDIALWGVSASVIFFLFGVCGSILFKCCVGYITIYTGFAIVSFVAPSSSGFVPLSSASPVSVDPSSASVVFV